MIDRCMYSNWREEKLAARRVFPNPLLQTRTELTGGWWGWGWGRDEMRMGKEPGCERGQKYYRNRVHRI